MTVVVIVGVVVVVVVQRAEEGVEVKHSEKVVLHFKVVCPLHFCF